MKPIVLLVLMLTLISCNTQKEEAHSFFIAGHTYGNPNNENHPLGLYKPFKDKFESINNESTIDLGFLLGDLVWNPKKTASWDAVVNDINTLRPKIHVARGNHDGVLEDFESRFGDSYKGFVHKKNLYIILDPLIDEWNISGDQLEFFKDAIATEKDNVDNIFIFTHPVIWWHNINYPKPFPNSLHYKSPDSNYWTLIEPMLKEIDKPIYLFAGDVGAFSKEKRKADHILEYDYHEDDNITYVSSGMGGGVRDNFVIVDISANGQVSFRLIHLNGDDINGLGQLTDNFKSNK
nr:metallophosphoesterase [uncultured Psychroserpens sp.]